MSVFDSIKMETDDPPLRLEPKRLTSLGHLNYRNVGLSFTVSVLMELEKELKDPKSKQGRVVEKAILAICEVIKVLPDELTTEELNRANRIWAVMEEAILNEPEYKELIDVFWELKCKDSEGQEVQATGETLIGESKYFEYYKSPG